MSKGRPEFNHPLGANDPAIMEQVFFWAGLGISPVMAMEALGMEFDGRDPDWFDVRLAMSAKSRGYYASSVRRAA